MSHTTTNDAFSRLEPESALDQGTAAAGSVAQQGDVRAEHVEIIQGGANTIDAQTVSIQQGGAASVRASKLLINQGGVALARVRRLSLREGSTAAAIYADEANVSGGSNVLLLIARNVTGDVRPLLDWRAAAAVGAGFGLVVSLLRRRR
ncbi:hypothetical protein BH23CHL7_BH23CHL7_13860 [soil metagenome]